jgi:hypothetical protein
MDGLSHPDPQQLAKYLDDTCTPLERAAIESHGAVCADCRAELIGSYQVLRSSPGAAAARRQLYFVPLAAAAVVLILLFPRVRQPAAVVDREPGVGTALAPVAATPSGDVAALTELTWTRVPGADAYQPTVFDSAGKVLWTVVVSDTSVAVPSSLREATARNYYWTVRARTGWDRWVASSLTRFRIVGGAATTQ